MAAWATGVFASMTFGPHLLPRLRASWQAASDSLRIAGSWLPLALIVSLFLVKYVAGVSLALHPQLVAEGDFIVACSLAYGLFSGLFAARGLQLWQVRRAARVGDRIGRPRLDENRRDAPPTPCRGDAARTQPAWRRLALRGAKVAGCCVLDRALPAGAVRRRDEAGARLFALHRPVVLALHRHRPRRRSPPGSRCRTSAPKPRGRLAGLGIWMLAGRRRSARRSATPAGNEIANRHDRPAPARARSTPTSATLKSLLVHGARAGGRRSPISSSRASVIATAAGRGRGGAAAGRRAAAEAARVAARAAHALQHAGQPARPDRRRPAARPGDARPADRLPARLARRLARRALHPLAAEFQRLRDYLALMEMRMGARLADALRSAARRWPRRWCRRCCCSRWSRTASSTASSRRSRGGRIEVDGRARRRRPRRCACATPASASTRGAGARRGRLRPGPRARAPGDALRRCGLVRARRRQATAKAARSRPSACPSRDERAGRGRSRDERRPDGARPDRRRRAAARREPARASSRALWPELEIVATVGDGAAAVDEALALRPDIVFLDIRMPGMSGLEAAQALAEDWPDGGAPFPLLVFVTAYDQYALQAFERAAVDYVLKPVAAGAPGADLRAPARRRWRRAPAQAPANERRGGAPRRPGWPAPSSSSGCCSARPARARRRRAAARHPGRRRQRRSTWCRSTTSSTSRPPTSTSASLTGEREHLIRIVAARAAAAARRRAASGRSTAAPSCAPTRSPRPSATRAAASRCACTAARKARRQPPHATASRRCSRGAWTARLRFTTSERLLERQRARSAARTFAAPSGASRRGRRASRRGASRAREEQARQRRRAAARCAAAARRRRAADSRRAGSRRARRPARSRRARRRRPRPAARRCRSTS